jgi:hypothetical protein
MGVEAVRAPVLRNEAETAERTCRWVWGHRILILNPGSSAP